MDWDKWNKRKCNILTTDLQTCSECEDIEDCYRYQSWFAKIPYFIIDQLQQTVSPIAFRVFIYLNRKANFTEKHDHYGMCWVSYQEIHNITGISVDNMRRYLKELRDGGFIKHEQSTQYFGRKHTTTNTFEVCWMKKLTQLKSLLP